MRTMTDLDCYPRVHRADPATSFEAAAKKSRMYRVPPKLLEKVDGNAEG